MTIADIKKIFLPKNIWVDKNNAQEARDAAPLPNGAVSLYEVVSDVITYLGLSPSGATDLGTSATSSTVSITSSTGTDITLIGATTSVAGIMTGTDKVNLAALSTLSGVSVGAVNLGAFTGSIIADNLTIKAALQSLETYTEAIPITTFGNLTPATAAVVVTNGTNAVKGSGTVIGLSLGNITLSSLGGTLNLNQLSVTSAVNGDVITFNGTTWVTGPVPTVAIAHNSLTGIQGGVATEYYHLKQSIYNSLTTSTTDRLIGRDAAGSGEITNISLANSLTFTGSNSIQLVNDATAPGNSKYYGTDGSGTKG